MYPDITKKSIGRRIEIEYAGEHIRGVVYEISNDLSHLVLLVDSDCPRWISCGKSKLGISMYPERYWKSLSKDIKLSIVRSA